MDKLKSKRIYYGGLLLIFLIVGGMRMNIYPQQNGEREYQLYCSRCHGNTDKRSGTLVFYSKNTITERYGKKSKQLLEKLINIDKYIKSHLMIRAVHKIEDKKLLIRIVNYLSDPDIIIPKKDKDKGI